MNLNLTDKQYLKAMISLENLVKSKTLKLQGFDDNFIGDKDTQCTWGLCGNNRDVYSDNNMHLFKDRCSPKYRLEHHKCPFEDKEHKDQTNGCFYRCKFFQYNYRPSIKEWLVMYNETIKWFNELKNK